MEPNDTAVNQNLLNTVKQRDRNIKRKKNPAAQNETASLSMTRHENISTTHASCSRIFKCQQAKCFRLFLSAESQVVQLDY